MSSIGTGYDLSASQFSPDGRVFQIDYASKAVEKSGTVIGLRGKDCVVLAVEKIVTSALYELDAGTRVFAVDKNIGIAIAGLLADGRYIVDVARHEATSFRERFNCAMPLQQLAERISDYLHAYTLYSAVRPFGISVILSAWDDVRGPQLYKIEPSGSSFGYFACASGKAKQQAKTEMEKFNFPEMTTQDLVQNAGRIIYQVHDELKDKDFRLELAIVGKETGGVVHINAAPWHAMATEAGKASKRDDDSDNDI